MKQISKKNSQNKRKGFSSQGNREENWGDIPFDQFQSAWEEEGGTTGSQSRGFSQGSALTQDQKSGRQGSQEPPYPYGQGDWQQSRGAVEEWEEGQPSSQKSYSSQSSWDEPESDFEARYASSKESLHSSGQRKKSSASRNRSKNRHK